MRSLVKLSLTSLLFLCTVVAYHWFNSYRLAHLDFREAKEPGLEEYVPLLAVGLLILFVRLRLKWLDELIAERQRKHLCAAAEDVLQECQDAGVPYAVYLRSFDLETRQNKIKFGLFGLGAKYYTARGVEALLLKAVDNRIPVLALSNPANPFSMPGVHRFGLRVTNWLDLLDETVKGAALVVIYYSDASPGLRLEMNLIVEMGLADKTLLIIGKTVSKRDPGLRECLPQFRSVMFAGAPGFKESLRDHLSRNLDHFPGHTAYQDMQCFHQRQPEGREKWIRYSFYSFEALLVIVTLTSLFFLDRYYTKLSEANLAARLAEMKVTPLTVNPMPEVRPLDNFDELRVAARDAQLAMIQVQFSVEGVKTELVGPEKQHIVFTYAALSRSKVEKIATKAFLSRLHEVGLTKAEFKDDSGRRWIFSLPSKP